LLVEALRVWRAGCSPRLEHMIRRAWGYVVVLGLYLIVCSQKTDRLIPVEGPYAWDFAPHIVLKNFRTYLCDTLYARDWLSTAPQQTIWGCVMLLVGLALILWRSHRYRAVVALGTGWFLISLVPVLFLSQRAYSFYAYFALAGVAIVLVVPVNVLLEAIHNWAQPLNTPGCLLPRVAGRMCILLLLVGWLWFSASQVRAMEVKDPAGIISKSVLARRAITEVQALYPALPANSTLCVVGLTNRDVWAFGHGDLFRLYYPQVQAVLVLAEEQEAIAASDVEGVYVYRFGGDE